MSDNITPAQPAALPPGWPYIPQLPALSDIPASLPTLTKREVFALTILHADLYSGKTGGPDMLADSAVILADELIKRLESK